VIVKEASGSLEAKPPGYVIAIERPLHLLCLSAKSEEALVELTQLKAIGILIIG
jgi:acyl transferase domain-containing protein